MGCFKVRICLAFAIVLVSSTAVFAEDFHFEFTAGYWPLKPLGAIQTSTTRVFLGPDMGIEGWKSHPAFKLVLKPLSKHRINLEIIPYRMKGRKTLERPFQLGGRTFVVQEQVFSKVSTDIFAGEYQYDVVNNNNGHVGISAGIAYLGGTARVNVVGRQATVATEEGKAPIPLVGSEFRIFPMRETELLNVNGAVKGAPLGSYGHYIQVNLNLGVAIAKSLRFQIGFSRVDFDAHVKDRTKGFDMRFSGPVFSLQLHD